MTPEVLNLPWQIQTALASGYAAYLLSYTGIRSHHKTVDTTFITLIFSLIATGVLALMVAFNPVYAVIAAFIAACVAGLFWRRWGRDLLGWLLRRFDVSWTNDDPSALLTLSANTSWPVSQIAVELDDGTWLRCDDTTKFNDAPFAPCLIGPTGDVALYLTHEEPSGKEALEITTARDAYYGDRLTYIPASRIRRLTVRHMKQK